MHGERLIDHFRNPRNAGALEAPAAAVEVMNPVCGDKLKLWARWVDGVAVEVRFQARGCTAAIACGSAVTELLTGLSRPAMAALTVDEVEDAVGGLINESKHAAVLCRDAARALSRTESPARGADPKTS
jgi:NifU-like protein involved in Fe-S cluster formation